MRLMLMFFLSLVLATEGEAQYRQPSLLANVVNPPSAERATLSPMAAPAPLCDGSLSKAVVGGALVGTVIGAVVSLGVGVRKVSRSMYAKPIDSLPYMVGGAVIAASVAAIFWQRNCGYPAAALP